MNDIYWFTGKQNHLGINNPKLILNNLRIPRQSISEIHYVSRNQQNQEIFQELKIKYWQTNTSSFDLIVLLINRLQGSDLESILILEENKTDLSYALLGKATIVGKYNLPPEFEIKNSGWVSPSTFDDWLNNSEITPKLISIKELGKSANLNIEPPEASSLLNAFIVSKDHQQIGLPLIFSSIGNNIISYLIVERI